LILARKPSVSLCARYLEWRRRREYNNIPHTKVGGARKQGRSQTVGRAIHFYCIYLEETQQQLLERRQYPWPCNRHTRVSHRLWDPPPHHHRPIRDGWEGDSSSVKKRSCSFIRDRFTFTQNVKENESRPH
jgi:hypothetical protein